MVDTHLSLHDPKANAAHGGGAAPGEAPARLRATPHCTVSEKVHSAGGVMPNCSLSSVVVGIEKMRLYSALMVFIGAWRLPGHWPLHTRLEAPARPRLHFAA